MYFLSTLSPAERIFLAQVQAFLAAELDDELVAAEDSQRTFVADHVRGNRWLDKLRARRWHVGRWPTAAPG